MRKDHRRLGDAQRVLHRRLADMREIDQHADPVQFAHHRLAERGQAVMLGIVGGAVGPVDRLRMGQRQIAGAEQFIGAQHREARVDLAAALDPHHRRDLARFVDAADIGGGGGEFERVGVARDDLADEIDLLERLDHLILLGLAGRDEHRPELPADHALPQSRDIGVVGVGERGEPLGEIEREPPLALAPAQRFRPIIMAVDQRRCLEDLRDARRDRIGRRGRRS